MLSFSHSFAFIFMGNWAGDPFRRSLEDPVPIDDLTAMQRHVEMRGHLSLSYQDRAGAVGPMSDWDPDVLEFLDNAKAKTLLDDVFGGSD